MFDFLVFKQLHSVGFPSPLSLSSAVRGNVRISLVFVSAFCLLLVYTRYNSLRNDFVLDE